MKCKLLTPEGAPGWLQIASTSPREATQVLAVCKEIARRGGGGTCKLQPFQGLRVQGIPADRDLGVPHLAFKARFFAHLYEAAMAADPVLRSPAAYE